MELFAVIYFLFFAIVFTSAALIPAIRYPVVRLGNDLPPTLDEIQAQMYSDDLSRELSIW